PTGTVRFTTDGSAPGPVNGRDYRVPINITGTRIIRAATFKAGALPSSVVTHSYILGQSIARRSLPVLSVVIDDDNLWGRTGIMEISPRNTSKRGIAWERPASVEFMFPEKDGGFALNCGLRIQGGNYVRDRYNPNGSLPFSKYSFRLYFRSDYGASKLVYPFFEIPIEEYDRIVLRAGMNDHSNPFISDELVRRLCADTGQVASHGNLVNFFLNGEYQGYYNPTERIDSAFLQSWHGGGEEWDVMAQFNEVREGSRTSWDSLLRTIDRSNFRVGSNYEKVSEILDIQNFIDYLLVNVFVATGDWPHNNWRAARERAEGAKWRFYVWDAEWSFGFRNGVNHNTFTNELASNTEIGRMYRRLRGSEEFRLKFADRIQKHFFNGGALSREHVTARYLELKNELRGMLSRPSRNVQSTWVPSRQTRIWPHFEAEGLLAEVATPTFSIPSGRLPQSVDLDLKTEQGIIYYTMDGTDPRVPISGAISGTAVTHRTGQDRLFLDRSMIIKMRSLDAGKWSALNEAAYQVTTLGSPIKITELMYHPVGSEALEFIELKNTSEAEVDLSGYSISGVTFSIPEGTVLEGGKFLLLVSDADPGLFQARYPRSRVFGYFDGSLSNSGESIKLRNRKGDPFLVLDYRDGNGWPNEADGEGFSLQIVNEVENPGNPGNWTRSREIGGSPGKDGFPIVMSSLIRLNEIMAFNNASVSNGGENQESFPDWVELYNAGNEAVSLEGWGLTDEGQPPKFTLGPNSVLEAGEYLVVWLDNRTALEGIHSGFGLNKDGDQLFLLNPEGQVVDQSVFGNQLEDLSIGRLPGLPREAWVLNQPTPGEANRSAVTAPLRNIRLNEWQSSPVAGDEDWVELYNRDEEQAVDLHGIFIGNGDVFQQISIPTFIEPKGHLVFTADQSSRAGHLIFKLPSQSSMIAVFRPNGSEIDRIQISNQPKGV
ncbi:MAG TPA: hypothetical protein EYG38_02295, partial [Verrucomicrobia bacterium]|nr:hypothetical protein [Verrucomicrobiota bacterium]